MDLWVRSQDREDLRRVDGFYISDVVGDSNSYYILERGYDFPLGEYKTKERVLEVFKEMMIKVSYLNLLSLTTHNMSVFSKINSFIYEMPKE